MKVVVTGATGLIGSALVPFLTAKGHNVTRLVRSQPRPESGDIEWHPESGIINADLLEGTEAVVHLAGENIAERWTEAKKERIRTSRADVTRFFSQSLAGLANPPRVLVSASATGYYGDRGDEVLREDSAAGSGFLPEVCRAWEAATQPAHEAGIRVVHLRLGIVLSTEGGALAKMLIPFRLGVGGNIGNGRQCWSWITLDDVIGIIHHALRTEALQGAVNTVSPHCVTNHEFTRTLGKVLRRPTVLPVPVFALRLAMGQMADELLLASARVEPARLEATSYAFRHPKLEDALRYLLSNR